jgi:hypothetical protein
MITATIISIVVLFDRAAISLPRAQRLFRQSSAIINRDIPEVQVRARRFIRVRGTPRIPLEYQNIALGVLSPIFDRHSPLATTVLLAPPGRSDRAPDIEYTIGQAILCGGRGYIAIVKKGHWMMNVIGLAHEIGHMIGAQHSADGVMHVSPILLAYFNDWKINFSEQSQEEIKRCSLPFPKVP